MTPNEISAHRVADALTAIHREWSTLSPNMRTALAVAFSLNQATFEQSIDLLASTIERLHPFEPISEAERVALAEEVVEELADMSTHEQVEDWLEQPEWQLRAEIEDRRDYMAEDAE